VWRVVFADDLDMTRRFILGFSGTCMACFDDNGDTLPRPGGAI